MSLIPLLLCRLSAAPVATPATASGRYDPGAGHRPVAAIVAVGLPAALLIAVALSPFELPILHPTGPTVVISLRDPIQPPPPDPDADPVKKSASQVSAPSSPLPPVAQNPLKPLEITDPPPILIDPPVGPGTTTVTDPVPPLPTLVAAKLDPRFAGSFQPDYPAFEQRNEIEGKARVRVLVGGDGRVKAVEDLGATSPGFFAETKRRALAKWRFKAATRGEAAEESWVVMTVRFRLEG